jgi:hypothetical protein
MSFVSDSLAEENPLECDHLRLPRSDRGGYFLSRLGRDPYCALFAASFSPVCDCRGTRLFARTASQLAGTAWFTSAYRGGDRVCRFRVGRKPLIYRYWSIGLL